MLSRQRQLLSASYYRLYQKQPNQEGSTFGESGLVVLVFHFLPFRHTRHDSFGTVAKNRNISVFLKLRFFSFFFFKLGLLDKNLQNKKSKRNKFKWFPLNLPKTNQRLFVENASNGGNDGFAGLKCLKKLILLNLLSLKSKSDAIDCRWLRTFTFDQRVEIMFFQNLQDRLIQFRQMNDHTSIDPKLGKS